MRFIGVIPVKENSNRFPNKNITEFLGKPLFCHSLDVLFESENISKIFLPTNSDTVKNYVNKNYNSKVSIIERGPFISKDEDPLLLILKFVHYSLLEDYDAMVIIMANCPGHTKKFLEEAIELFINSNSNEFRSFDSLGIENGLFIFKKDVIEKTYNISSHICSLVNDKAVEIHYKNELDSLIKKLD